MPVILLTCSSRSANVSRRARGDESGLTSGYVITERGSDVLHVLHHGLCSLGIFFADAEVYRWLRHAKGISDLGGKLDMVVINWLDVSEKSQVNEEARID